ncbi:MAG TPA: hypothetical protein VJ417_02820, partial [Candidatus Glassbacteria bacterium]|nr:hypothetical protein [Candidatus Glassbacteria bacterium]
SLSLILKSGVIFSGATIDDRGNPVASVGLSLVDNQNYQYRWGSSDEKGNFSIAVFPGTFDIYVYAPYEYPAQPMVRAVEIQSYTGKDILIDSGKQVSGTVFSAAGEPLVGVSLVFRGDYDSRWAQSGEDGSYRVALLAGTYWVQVYGDNQRLIPQQFVGPVDVAEDLSWDIKLAAAGVLAGTVVDDRGNKVTGATINVWQIVNYSDPTAGDSVLVDGSTAVVVKPADTGITVTDPAYYYQYFFQFVTDEQGAWQGALMPGQYVVEVYPPYDYPQKGYKVDVFEVAEKERTEVGEVKVEYGVQFSGRVTLADGSPLAWESVQVVSAETTSGETSAGIIYPLWEIPVYQTNFYTDGEGNFTCKVFPGIYDLYFYGGYGDKTYPRQTVEKLDLNRDLSLTVTL